LPPPFLSAPAVMTFSLGYPHAASLSPGSPSAPATLPSSFCFLSQLFYLLWLRAWMGPLYFSREKLDSSFFPRLPRCVAFVPEGFVPSSVLRDVAFKPKTPPHILKKTFVFLSPPHAAFRACPVLFPEKVAGALSGLFSGNFTSGFFLRASLVVRPPFR